MSVLTKAFLVIYELMIQKNCQKQVFTCIRVKDNVKCSKNEKIKYLEGDECLM